MAALKLAIMMICILGFVYQAGQICLTYFSYTSSSSIHLTSSRYLNIPSFSYCMPHYSLSVDETIAEINARMVPYASLLQCTLGPPERARNGGENGCREHFKQVTKVFGLSWCLQYQNGGMKMLRSLALQDKLVVVHVERHTQTYYGLLWTVVYLHSTDMRISHWSRLVAVQDGYHLVYFRKLEVTRLPSPYGGHCRNYREDGYLSAVHCLDNCIVWITMEKFQKWPLWVAADVQLNISIGEANSKMDLEYCSEKCDKADCHVDSYLIDKIFFSTPDYNYTTVEIKVSTEFDIQATESAKFELIELVCYLAGLATFWFGGSVLTLSSGLLAKSKFRAKTRHDSSAKICQISKSRIALQPWRQHNVH
ncbi:hypothetical protein HDE_05712 [Halotydeus destructor]|nr:hypothetical protein HDE_05712 [Halotydeus destructor]